MRKESEYTIMTKEEVHRYYSVKAKSKAEAKRKFEEDEDKENYYADDDEFSAGEKVVDVTLEGEMFK